MSGFLDSLDKIYRHIGYAICHQAPDRSLYFDGRQMPVCARDTGIFLGAMAALLILFLIHKKKGKLFPSWKINLFSGALVLPAIIDGITTYAGWRTSNNDIRLATGLLAGVGIASLLFPFISRELFPDAESEPILSHVKELIALLLSAGTLYLFLQVQWRGSYWLWSTLVCLGMISVLFLLLYTLISLVAARLSPGGKGLRWHVLSLFSVVATTGILVAANRLHWLLTR